MKSWSRFFFDIFLGNCRERIGSQEIGRDLIDRFILFDNDAGDCTTVGHDKLIVLKLFVNLVDGFDDLAQQIFALQFLKSIL